MPLQAQIKGSFSDLIAAASERLQESLAASVREFATSVYTDLVNETPKLSGQAAGNWQVTLGDSNDTFIEVRPRRVYHPDVVQEALDEVSVIEGFQMGQTITIFNNAPYMQLLNQGYSKQAPAGYIQAIIARYQDVIGSAGSAELGGDY